MKASPRVLAAWTSWLATAAMLACSHPATKVSDSWNPKAAAAYLDKREAWWMGWPVSARDHGTFCISCHTALPYALSRPRLRVALAEKGPSVDERKLIDNVSKRVRLWNQVELYYADEKTAESRGTESVLNALILASYDTEVGRLSDDTRLAFDHMWGEQQTTGGWQWLQFDQEPWEANDSGYYGATLAAMAVVTAPGDYASIPEIQPNLERLRGYLQREAPAQSLINRVFLLWASAKMPGLLRDEQQKAIIQEVLSKQQADGGWRLASIAWRWNGWSIKSLVNMWIREDGTPMRGKSDGVATAVITLALEQAGVTPDNVQLKRGLAWLMTNQNTAEGFWPASSVNKRRHLSSDTGRFMSDAATAYAVLALTENWQDTAANIPKR